MFRKTLITAAFASMAFFALGSAAPASADVPNCFFEPAGCGDIGIHEDGSGMSIFDLDLTDDTDSGALIHLIPDPGVQVAPIDVPERWQPGFDFDDIIVPGPTEEEPAEEPAEEPVEESVEESAEEPAGELSEASVDEPTTTTVAPAADSPSVEATSSANPGDGTQVTTTAAAESAGSAGSADGEADAAMTGTGTGGTFDPIMAAVFGALGALAVALLTLTGFIAGRRS